jgi:hypothetical protein
MSIRAKLIFLKICMSLPFFMKHTAFFSTSKLFQDIPKCLAISKQKAIVNLAPANKKLIFSLIYQALFTKHTALCSTFQALSGYIKKVLIFESGCSR